MNLAVTAQHLLPKRLLTQLAGWLARRPGPHAPFLIRRFIARYKVDMSEAANPDIASYATFNDFFARALREGARPLAQADWVCPADGVISQLGPIQLGQLIQAKGHHYSATALLGGDEALAGLFNGGHFATIYLSPRDYHRIHMPCEGRLRQMIYVPGDLYSVNFATAEAVPGLFARNERVISVFDTACGPLVLVMVGAAIVGSMATVWHGTVNPPRTYYPRQWRYRDERALTLAQGAEMGRFLLGSTVILLWPREAQLRFAEGLLPGQGVRMGQALASFSPPSASDAADAPEGGAPSASDQQGAVHAQPGNAGQADGDEQGAGAV